MAAVVSIITITMTPTVYSVSLYWLEYRIFIYL